jgi:hypothetical protein
VSAKLDPNGVIANDPSQFEKAVAKLDIAPSTLIPFAPDIATAPPSRLNDVFTRMSMACSGARRVFARAAIRAFHPPNSDR